MQTRYDTASAAWVERLRAEGPEQAVAIRELRELLLRAARFEVTRRQAAAPHLHGVSLEDVAEQAADDALVAIMSKLDHFRGESRFTTWAYKFALLEAGVKVRRLAWRGREISLEPERWPQIADPHAGPEQAAETARIIEAMRDAINHQLTPHQREILVAITVNDIPIDVLAERLNTTRGALYKTLHDARRKLRAHLSELGLSVGTAEEATS